MTGADPWPWFRFPFGDYSQRVIQSLTGPGSCQSGGPSIPSAGRGTSGGITTQLIINRVPGSLRPGEIVLMHCGPGGMKAGDHSTPDADALPTVIQSVRYSSVTVDALRGLGYHVRAIGGAVPSFGEPRVRVGGGDAGLSEGGRAGGGPENRRLLDLEVQRWGGELQRVLIRVAGGPGRRGAGRHRHRRRLATLAGGPGRW